MVLSRDTLVAALCWLLPLAFLKPLMTSVSLGGGGSGGIFAPSLFLGATTGASFGLICNYLFPDVSANPTVYAIVGMGAVVAGTTHGVLSAILICYEMTDAPGIILPIMFAAGLASVIARVIDPESIYHKKLSRRGESIARGHEMHHLEHIMVRDVMLREFPRVNQHDDVTEIIRVARAHPTIESLPVMNSEGRFVGVIRPEDLHRVLDSDVSPQLVYADDITLKAPISVSPDENLLETLRDFGSRDIETLQWRSTPTIRGISSDCLCVRTSCGVTAKKCSQSASRVASVCPEMPPPQHARLLGVNIGLLATGEPFKHTRNLKILAHTVICSLREFWLMRLRLLSVAACCLGVWSMPCAAADAANSAVTDLAQVDGDFYLQGEYFGNVNYDFFAAPNMGLQVVALGDGQFDARLLRGGLPGAGWDRGSHNKLSGTRSGSYLLLEGDDYQIEVTPAEAVVQTPQRIELARLPKIHRISTTQGAAPPPRAVVLFDGTSTDQLDNGKITPKGLLDVGAMTKMPVDDFRLHIEFRTPYMPKARGQGRGNSGVYIQQRYEVQVLDSFGLEGVENECGGLYKQKRPDVNMALPPLSWQTYDIYFTAVRWSSEGKKASNARITVLHNGESIHSNYDIVTKTGAGKPESAESRPILFQNHRDPVRFRNMWLVPTGVASLQQVTDALPAPFGAPHVFWHTTSYCASCVMLPNSCNCCCRRCR